MNARVFIRKKTGFTVESRSLHAEFRDVLGMSNINTVVLYDGYDIFNAEAEDLRLLVEEVLTETVTDEVLYELPAHPHIIAAENLPGQYDQRGDSAEQCLMLLNGKDSVRVQSFRVIALEGNLTPRDLKKITNYTINPVEMREKDLDKLALDEEVVAEDVKILEGFEIMSDAEREKLYDTLGLAMHPDDFAFIQSYFRDEERRSPTEAEIRVLDTYWSDHCRHTTFETELKDISVEEGPLKKAIETSLREYLNLRREAGREEKPLTLMDMATVYGKYLRSRGQLSDLEESEEINACSIVVEVDEEGEKRPWLLMFKNETHNHPTEIEPFGGASTCIGGAIRDPLSGRAYVYQAMRITGAGNVWAPVDETMEGKLPQSVITKTAARGYSSYGNQIGLPTTYVQELYHDRFVAKRMEVGAVVGAAPIENVVRESPAPGDVILLLGGDTGRDGVGGATGSSVEHTAASLTKASSEVQKGNAIIERKLQRLFRNPDATRLIKKANDFGAGGVSVAIGELARGIDVNLDAVPLKYSGLSGTEIAISESQERMAVVLAPENVEKFTTLAAKENLNAVVVAHVTDDERLRMRFRDQCIVDLARSFLDTNGVRQTQSVSLVSNTEGDPFTTPTTGNFRQDFLNNLRQPNTALQKGMAEMFDFSIGKSTVLAPYGGTHQLTPAEAGVQKIPVPGLTSTASALAFGYNPDVAVHSPYLGGSYSLVEALARLVAVGADYKNARLSCQEYFGKPGTEPKRWGWPAQALLGNLDAQRAFGTPSIGGKDSMSGTFHDIDVPPTLITFAVATVDVSRVHSPEWKEKDSYLYALLHPAKEHHLPDYDALKANFEALLALMDKGSIRSAMTIKFGGIAEALTKMSIGNRIGADVATNLDLFSPNIGGFVLESEIPLEGENFHLLGRTGGDSLVVNGESFDFDELEQAVLSRNEALFPTEVRQDGEIVSNPPRLKDMPSVSPTIQLARPRVYLPVFPGTNCEYDTHLAFERAGGDVHSSVFRNLQVSHIAESIDVIEKNLTAAQIFVLAGGFSAADEPAGSGKFIANVLKNKRIKNAIDEFLERGGLILGICNGFQALIKSGLLPYGAVGSVAEDSPTLFRNDIDRHVAKFVTTKVVSNSSPWLSSFEIDQLHTIPVSHGEGKFVVTEGEAAALFAGGQVAFQYADKEGRPTMNGRFNPNGSAYAIEGITSPDGRILGTMGHGERYEDGLFQNIYGDKCRDIFANGVAYFR